MPVQNLKAMSDSDIRALFAYLQSIPAIKSRTPQPIERSPISQMPPIGSVIADRQAVDLLASWVNNAEEWKQLRAGCATQGR